MSIKSVKTYFFKVVKLDKYKHKQTKVFDIIRNIQNQNQAKWLQSDCKPATSIFVFDKNLLAMLCSFCVENKVKFLVEIKITELKQKKLPTSLIKFVILDYYITNKKLIHLSCFTDIKFLFRLKKKTSEIMPIFIIM